MRVGTKVPLSMFEILMTTALAASATVPAYAAEVHRFNVPTEQAVDAVRDFAAQAHVQILVDGANIKDKHLHSVLGEFSTQKGLEVLLAETGLKPHYVGDHSIALVTPEQEAAGERADGAKEGKKSDSFRMGPVARGAPGSTSLDNQASSSSQGEVKDTIEEIIVTAQKRNERLQDVPVPVTALNASTLVDQNQVRLQDYYATVPGLNFTVGNRGEPSLSIRGISTGLYNNPTVGVTIDDVQYGSSTALGGGYAVPDVDPNDLARVEVLRGPQGTLYGASSIGGLVKYVTIAPSLTGWAGHIQAGLNKVQSGSDPGYNVSAAVNTPLADTVAVRASSFVRRDPGYIDNIQDGQADVNTAQVYGGRVAALWNPSQDWMLKLSALYQKNNRDGSPDVFIQPGLGDLQQDTLRNTGRYDKEIQAYSANLTGKVAGIDITSLTGYSRNKGFASVDYTSAYSSLSEGFYQVAGTPIEETVRTSKFSEEVRLSSVIAERFDWLLGGFYTRERSSVNSVLASVDPATGIQAGTLFTNSYPTAFNEYAIFTDLTVHFTERFNIQLGGRESWNDQTYSQDIYGPLFGNTSIIAPELQTKENSFTYLVTPQYKISPEMMAYARFASGYRPGGPNGSCVAFNFPCHFAPDKTNNYEVGIKADVLDHMLSFDASLYYIDWKNIQITVTQQSSGETYSANGSRAKSQGLELSTHAKPLTGLSLTAWVAWDDAVLQEPFPSTSTVNGATGDRLPYSSRFSGDFAVEQSFPVMNGVTGFVAGEARYAGDRQGVFMATSARQDLPGYAQFDLRGGLRLDTWTVNVFVNNVADRRGVLDGGLGTFPVYAFTYIQPRTMGVTAGKVF
jgi:iron complex outermembrane recepter protein